MNDHEEIRRRRECESCGFRFTTFEKIEETPLVVVKKEGSREEFSREKVLRGLIRACEKRPVALDVLEGLVLSIEKDLRRIGNAEYESEDIGEMVMDRFGQKLMRWPMFDLPRFIVSLRISMYLLRK
ncbi:Transcriptional repressor NrdR [Lysinibacillus sphaericus]